MTQDKVIMDLFGVRILPRESPIGMPQAFYAAKFMATTELYSRI